MAIKAYPNHLEVLDNVDYWRLLCLVDEKVDDIKNSLKHISNLEMIDSLNFHLKNYNRLQDIIRDIILE